MPPIRTGFIDFVVGKEIFKTWYKIVGDLGSADCPVVALHGGPGSPYRLLDPFMDLAESHGLTIIFYDQLGAGNSTILPDKPDDFWTVELFMDELDNLLQHFKITEKFSLFGHSWGGMLGSDYVATRRPAGAQRLVFASSPASIPLWEVSTRSLLKQLPDDVRKKIEEHEAAGETSHPEYVEGMNAFYHRFVCKLDPWPEELTEAIQGLEKNSQVYGAMLGPSEFTVTGSLKHWSVIDKLHNITSPTLIINGSDDEAQDVAVAPFFERIPHVKWVHLVGCSHMAYFEERERYMKIVGDFLTSKY